MSAPKHPLPDSLTTVTQRLVCTAIVLGLLYVGKDILIPTVTAIILGFGLMPLVRRLQAFGLNRVISVILVVLTSCIVLGNVMLTMGTQLIRIAESLPQYQENIRNKLISLDEITLGKAKVVLAKADRIAGSFTPQGQARKKQADASKQDAAEVMTMRMEEREQTPQEVIRRAFGAVVHFAEVAGLVLVVLIFVLIDYEALRDRLIRLVGGRNIRETTTALNEASDKLTRYFGTQIAINLLSGAVVGMSLHWLGVPEATFWGALTAISRFIPYVGAWVAMAAASLMAAAVVPAWSLALATMGVFVVIELGVSQIIEPKLYGHSTGLSPVSVVIGTIFWAALWGPVGLILATPLTLLIVVASRYTPSMQFIELLLGDVPGLSAAERFYQRALAGDSHELTLDLQRYLRRRSTSEYCDHVLAPFMALAKEDFSQRAVTEPEINSLTQTITTILSTLGKPSKRKAQRLQHMPNASSAQGEVLILAGSDHVSDMHAHLVLSVFTSSGRRARVADASCITADTCEPAPTVQAIIYIAADFDACAEIASLEAYKLLHKGEGLKFFAFLSDPDSVKNKSIPSHFPPLLKTYREVQAACDAL